MATSKKTGIQRCLPSWLRFGKQAKKPTSTKPRDPMIGKKILPNGPPPWLPTYEDLHDTPFKPMRRQEELRILESVDVIMSQVRKRLEKIDPGTIDLVAVEHSFRSYCIVTATTAGRATRYGDDMEDIDRMKREREQYLKVALGLAHGPENKLLIHTLLEKAWVEALYYQRALKPCDIKLGTYFQKDRSDYRYIGLTK